jgi:transcriptional regulator with XRE-family HTH domain
MSFWGCNLASHDKHIRTLCSFSVHAAPLSAYGCIVPIYGKISCIHFHDEKLAIRILLRYALESTWGKKMPKKNPKDVGKRIRLLREAHSMTPTELAEILKVTPAAVWHWENAGTVPRGETLNLVAQTFSVARSYLETGEQAQLGDDSEEAASHSRPAVEEMSLEELMRAIEDRGFEVYVRSKNDRSSAESRPPLLAMLGGRSK